MNLPQAHRDKIKSVLQEYSRLLDETPEDQLLSFMRGYNVMLAEWLKDENRLMAYSAGDHVEPKVHFAEGVLIGKLGGDE